MMKYLIIFLLISVSESEVRNQRKTKVINSYINNAVSIFAFPTPSNLLPFFYTFLHLIYTTNLKGVKKCKNENRIKKPNDRKWTNKFIS